MKTYSELELAVHRLFADSYQIECRYTDIASDLEIAPVRGTCDIDSSELLKVLSDQDAYGAKLAEQFFSSSDVRAMFDRVKSVVEAQDRHLRVRLLVGSTAPELHSLRWELLRDPCTGQRLATSERVLFSRFLASQDWRPSRLRPKKDELRAFIAVAAPTVESLEQYPGLAEVDRQGEIDRARRSLDGMSCESLADEEPLTLGRLLSEIRDGIDVLYLVAHGGSPRRGAPQLFLQDDNGDVAVVKVSELATRLSESSQLPRLVVLASCESAGTGKAARPDDETILSTLAPRLVDAGVPAVVAMQGKISMETVKSAMPVFFRELLRDGQVDRALAVARGEVRERPDSWMPALFLRLKGGRLWYEPGFADDGSDFNKWKSICSRARHGELLPIVGPDLAEAVCGSTGELADRLAEAEKFPLAEHQRRDLPKVAQYVSVTQGLTYAQRAVGMQMKQQVLERNAEAFDEGSREERLSKLLRTAGEFRRRDPSDPHVVLTELGAKVYVSAAPQELLVDSLQSAGRSPRKILPSWRQPLQASPASALGSEEEPTAQEPVVFHVFGSFAEPESLVLTEDDYFDYLIAVSKHKVIPLAVGDAMTASSLLFLGFRLDDWTFRVLFRMIMASESSGRLRQFAPHVGVQIDPEEHSLSDARRAREYLEGYFLADRSAGFGGEAEPQIDIYWGTAADFLAELQKQISKSEGEVPSGVSKDEDSGWF